MNDYISVGKIQENDFRLVLHIYNTCIFLNIKVLYEILK